MRIEERLQALAAAFLLAFQQYGDADRQRAMHRDPGAESFDEGHHLALVVHSPAGDDAFATLCLDDLWFERIAIPELIGIGRLHIVMAVIEQVRRAFRALEMTHDHRMLLGVTHGGIEADLGELRGHPFGGSADIRRIFRVGTDAGDAQYVDKPFD